MTRRRRTVVFYDAGPADEASRRAARRLWLAGHRDVAVLAGGLEAWRAAGLPVEPEGEAEGEAAGEAAGEAVGPLPPVLSVPRAAPSTPP